MIKRLLVYLVVSVVAFIGVLWFVGVKDVMDSLLSMDPVWLIPIGILVIPPYIIRGFRWRLLLNAVVVDPPEPRQLTIWVILGDFINYVLPVGGAGAVFKSALYSKVKAERFSLILSTVTVERAFDGFIVAFLGFIGALMLGRYDPVISFVLGLVFGLSVLAFVLIALFRSRKELFMRIAGYFARFFPQKAAGRGLEIVSGLLDGTKAVRFDRSTLKIMLLSFGVWVCGILANISLFNSASMPINLGVIIVGSTIFALAILIPSPPLRAGSFEVMWTFTFGLVGVPLDKALAMGIAVHLVILLVFMPLGVASLFHLGLGFKDLTLKKNVRR